MPVCYRCQVDKPNEDFAINRAAENGLQAQCRECQRATRIARGVTKPPGWQRKTENIVEYRREYKKNNRTKLRALEARRYRKDKKKVLARKALRYAVKTGQIVREPCSNCGAEKSHGHHPDYSKPLEVIWLCAPCHRLVHSLPDAAEAQVSDSVS